MNDNLIKNMDLLKQDMISVSNQMRRSAIGQKNHIQDHAMELLGASTILQTWIDGIEKEQSK